MSILRSSALAGLSAFFVSALLESSAAAQAPVPRLTPRLRSRPSPPSPAPAPNEEKTEKEQPSSSFPDDRGERDSKEPPGTTATPSPPAPVPAPVPLTTPAVEPVMGGFRPPLLPALKGTPPPEGYVERLRYNVPMLVGGGITLAVTWGTSIAYGATQDFENGLGALAVPILGPWMALGQRDFTCEVQATTDVTQIEASQDDAQACIANQTATAGFLVGLGVGQLVGASLLTVGLLDRRRHWVRMDLAGVDVQLDPGLSPGLAGVMASGSF